MPMIITRRIGFPQSRRGRIWLGISLILLFFGLLSLNGLQWVINKNVTDTAAGIREIRYTFGVDYTWGQGGYDHRDAAVFEAKRQAHEEADKIGHGFEHSLQEADIYVDGAIAEIVPNSTYEGPFSRAFKLILQPGEKLLVMTDSPKGGVVTLTSRIVGGEELIELAWYPKGDRTEYHKAYFSRTEIGQGLGYNMATAEAGNKLELTVNSDNTITFERPISES